MASAGSHISRLEVLEGPTGRRTWPDEVKAQIVAESFEPGVKVSAVARRHGLTPQHLTEWRRAAREGRLVLPSAEEGPFARLVVGDSRAAAQDDHSGCGSISIEMDGVVVRVPVDISAARLGEIIRVLRLT
ncbi:transposase [Hyphomonas sp.]|uniref:IS66-like element accessory protein TnpA n=1 Tax=Hyphomonas sp. TaxID=87 RepID=UPI0025BBAB35|nr:transposase [Hyphomonas sp.]